MLSFDSWAWVLKHFSLGFVRGPWMVCTFIACAPPEMGLQRMTTWAIVVCSWIYVICTLQQGFHRVAIVPNWGTGMPGLSHERSQQLYWSSRTRHFVSGKINYVETQIHTKAYYITFQQKDALPIYDKLLAYQIWKFSFNVDEVVSKYGRACG